MTPSLIVLTRYHVADIAETSARDAGTTLEAMFSDSRRRRDSRARALFFQALHDSGRFTIRAIAALVEKSEWTVHSAVFQSPRKRYYIKGGYSRVRGSVQVRGFDEGEPNLGIAQVEDAAQVPRRDLAGGDGHEQGAAGAVRSRRSAG